MNPVIRSVTVTPNTVQPGGTATVTIDAYDPDSRSVTFEGSVTDSNGNVTHASTTLTVGDPLTYSLTCGDPSVGITQDPTLKNTFHITVPA